MKGALVCGLLLALGLSGCEEKQKTKGKPTTPVKEPTEDPKNAGHVTPTGQMLPQPVAEQSIPDRSELRFLGFGHHGRIYAFESMYGFRGETDGDVSCFVRFREVILAESGEVIARFRLERRDDDPTQFDRLWDQEWQAARDVKEWDDFVSKWAITPVEASASSGEWRLNITPPDSLPPLTSVDVKKEGASFVATWTMYQEPRNDRDERYLKKNKGKPYKRRSPKIEAHLLGAKKSWLQLAARPPYKRAELENYEKEPVVTARYTPYWNEPKTQVLWIVEYSGGEPGRRTQARHFLRTVGPQVKVIDAGSGQMAERAAIGTLHGAGYPVVATDTSEAPVKGRSVYYRGQAEAEAQAIAKLLGEDVLIEELTKPGWIDIIVYLGNADPNAPTAKQDAAAMVAVPMDGPYESKGAICARFKSEGRPCSSSKGRKVRGSSPFAQAVTVIAGDMYENEVETTFLLVDTGEAWFATELFDTQQAQETLSGQVGPLKLEDLHPAEGSELVFDVQSSSSLETDVDGLMDESQSSKWVCAVGSSGKPSCLDIMLDYDYDFPADNVKKRWRFEIDFLEDGRLRIDHKGTALNDRSIVGTHELLFP